MASWKAMLESEAPLAPDTVRAAPRTTQATSPAMTAGAELPA